MGLDYRLLDSHRQWDNLDRGSRRMLNGTLEREIGQRWYIGSKF